MSFITDSWRQLVRRRLWPVAVLLLGALVAVPVLLSEEPEPVVVAAPEEAADARRAVAAVEPIVAPATHEDRDRRRRVLGVRKNPFQPVPVPTPEPPETVAPSLPDLPGGQTGGSSAPSPGGGTGISVPPGSSAPSAPSAPLAPPSLPTTPQEPKPSYTLYELTIRFGDGAATGERRQLERLEALPDADEPLLVYLGPGKGGRSAIFLLDAAVKTEGDGTCDPDPATCETIELREGETQFFDVTDPETGASVGEYQLDLVKIHRKKTSDAKKAAKARAAESKAGRRALKAHVAAGGPLRYDYDRETGTVRRLGRAAYTAKVAAVEAVLGR